MHRPDCPRPSAAGSCVKVLPGTRPSPYRSGRPKSVRLKNSRLCGTLFGREARREEPAAGIDDMSVRYGLTVAVDSVTLAVERGCVYALLGRNGAGKSSIVRCLLGQQRPSAGRATLFGEDAWKSRRSAMARVGVVPEEPDVPPEMTAAEAVAFCARLYPTFDRAGVGRRLEKFGVPTAVPAGRLSKGQKGQLGLVLALAPGPRRPHARAGRGGAQGTLRGAGG